MPLAAQDNNAATHYQRAFDRLPEMTNEDWAVIERFEAHPNRPADAEMRALLQRVEPAMRAARAAAQHSTSDFGVDYAKGFAAEIPHLMPMRQLFRFVRYDAERHLRDGNPAMASEALAPTFAMINHVAQDGAIINSLVSMGMFVGSNNVIQNAIDRGQLGAADAITLLDGLKRLHGSDDPFGVGTGIMREAEMIGEWMPERFSGEDGRQRFAEEVLGSTDGAAAAMIVSQEQFEADMALAGDTMNTIAEIMTSDLSFEQKHLEMDIIVDQLRNDELGMVAKLTLPALDRVLESWEISLKRLDELDYTLRLLAEQRVEPEALLNAAVFYQDAIRMLDALSEDIVENVRDIAQQPDQIPDEETTAGTFDQLAPIIATIARAEPATRCTFVDDRERMISPQFVATHHYGLRDLGHVLLADAIRLVHSGRHSDALDRVRLCYRMAWHLSLDEHVMTALVGQRVAEAAEPHLRSLLDRSDIDVEQRTRGAETIEALSSRDPFGIAGAIARERRLTFDRYERRRSSYGAHWPVVAESLRNLSDGEVVAVMVAGTWSQFVVPPSDAQPPRNPGRDVPDDVRGWAVHPHLERLADVIDVDAIPDLIAGGHAIVVPLRDDSPVTALINRRDDGADAPADTDDATSSADEIDHLGLADRITAGTRLLDRVRATVPGDRGPESDRAGAAAGNHTGR